MRAATSQRPGASCPSRRPRVTLWILCLLTSAATQGATLRYEAYVGGLRIGTAIVVLERSDTRYHIEGEAVAEGVADLFGDWRSVFHASGEMVAGRPRLASYGYDETDRAKQRILSWRDGHIQVVKNGRRRPARPAPTALDVLTAFFVDPDCWLSRTVHTGRHAYRLSGAPATAGRGCTFLVEEDDGDRSQIRVTFTDLQGASIPARLDTSGLISGRILLTEVDGRSATTDAD